MRKIAKIVGFVGGVAAVVWAMRDRLISIAAPREPQPPTFRVVPPIKEADDLTEITGIGATYAGRLAEAGIRSYADLARAGAARVADAAGVSVARAEDWISQATTRV